MSWAGRAGLNRKPCISVHPSSVTVFNCCCVSTPSAVVAMRKSAASWVMARTIASDSSLPTRSTMNERSILIFSNGKLRR